MFLHDKEKSQSKDPTKNIVTNTTTDIVNISSLGAPKYCKRTIIAVLIILYFSFEQPKCVGNLAKCGSETLFKIKQGTLYNQSICSTWTSNSVSSPFIHMLIYQDNDGSSSGSIYTYKQQLTSYRTLKYSW